MSEERLRELGIPRRSFLKGTAAAAFAAPVVVSFGLDGIAEASTGHTPYHCVANMSSFPNQTTGTPILLCGELLAIVGFSFGEGRIELKGAERLANKVALLTLQIAGGKANSACKTLFDLSHDEESPDVIEFIPAVEQLSSQLGCVCTPVSPK